LIGSAGGLTTTGSSIWNQGKPGIPDSPESPDGFGASLAFGDLNGDGNEDLAIGVPYEGHSGVLQAGLVDFVYGNPAPNLPSASGLDRRPLAPEEFGRFGEALTTTDGN